MRNNDWEPPVIQYEVVFRILKEHHTVRSALNITPRTVPKTEQLVNIWRVNLYSSLFGVRVFYSVIDIRIRNRVRLCGFLACFPFLFRLLRLGSVSLFGASSPVLYAAAFARAATFSVPLSNVSPVARAGTAVIAIIKRIADGSGTSLPDVNKLLKQFEGTRKLMKGAVTGSLMQQMKNFRR